MGRHMHVSGTLEREGRRVKAHAVGRRWQCTPMMAMFFAVATACRESTSPRPIPAIADALFGAGETRWFLLDTLGGGVMPPAIDAERVYVTRGEFTVGSELAALDRMTGDLLWHQRAQTYNGAAFVFDVIGGAYAALTRFNRRTGAMFPTGLPGAVESNIVSDGNRFFVGVGTGEVVAVNGLSGAIEWKTKVADGTRSAIFGVALSGGSLAATLKYFPPQGERVDSGIVVVLESQSGAVRWRRVFAGETRVAGISDPPVFAANIVAVVSQSHDVHALDVSSGATRWTYDATRGKPTDISDGITACDGAVFVSNGDRGLVSLDAESGAEQWRLPDLQIGGVTRLDCSYGTVLALASLLRVYDARTGTLLRRFPISDRDGTFIMSAGRDERSIYITTQYGFGAVKAP